MSKLHEIYKVRCSAVSKQPFSIYTFTQYFKDHNFSLFQRKKDLCNTCVGYDEGNVTSTEYDAHQKRKNDALNLKEEELNLHNFTFYNLKNKDVMNYLWSEVNGDLEVSNFTRNMQTLQRLLCGLTVAAIKTNAVYSLVRY